SSRNNARITLFKPGHKPPQVTIPARVFAGSKNNFARGPASSKSTSSRLGAAGSRTITAGIRAWSLTVCGTGEGNRASPREVMFINPPPRVRASRSRSAPDAITDGRYLEGSQRIHVAGREPAEAAVSKTRFVPLVRAEHRSHSRVRTRLAALDLLCRG